MRRAVIDVGTNSVKVLVAEVRAPAISPLLEKSWQTRLGAGFYATHRLQPEAVARTAVAVAEFATLARQLQATSIRVIATSAAREAENQADLVAAVRAASGLSVIIISGEQEAEWVYLGVHSDPQLGGRQLLILDVGGGSSEFILGADDHHTFRQSLDLGAVRLTEWLRPGDPPSPEDAARCQRWLADFFRERLAPDLARQLAADPAATTTLIATGGTSTILARLHRRMSAFGRGGLEGTRLSRDQVVGYRQQLWSLTLAERKRLPGMSPSRADILPAGVAIYEAAMAHFGLTELFVSTRGLRFGALLAEGVSPD